MRVVVVVLAALATGCFSKPGFGGGGGDDVRIDAPVDGDGSAPVARLASYAYYSTMPNHSTGMTHDHFSIPRGDIVDGDLVLFIANIDNGSDAIFPDGLGSGFHQLVQHYYGPDDGQTYVVMWKTASAEPPFYVGDYFDNAGGSSAVTIALVAITGAGDTAPTLIDDHGSSGDYGNPSMAISSGVTTTVPSSLVVYAAGADWVQPGMGSSTFTTPNLFTSLSKLGDMGLPSGGTVDWYWTMQEVAWRVMTTPGPTGQLVDSMQATPSARSGAPWDVVIVIPPR